MHRVFGYPGDGINGLLGAFGRADGDPEFIQPRHEEMAAFMACAHAKFIIILAQYGISMDCGEQALLPAVRDADPGVLIVADGFSCKTQIEHSGAGRHALHTAEVMMLARRGEEDAARLPQPSAARRFGRVAAA